MATQNSAVDAVFAGLQRVEKSLSTLDSQRSLLANCISAWKGLEQCCYDVQTTLQARINCVDEKEEKLLAKFEEEKATLRRRAEAVPIREKASLARVKEQKDAAIAAVLEERRKWIQTHLGERASAYLAAKSLIGGDAKSFTGKDGRAKAMVRDVKVQPQLKSLCDKMDAEGLRNFLMTNRKEASVMRDQLPCALSKSPHPLRLVLKTLEGYDLKPDPNPGKETKVSSIRRAYLSLLESLAMATADPVLGAEYPIVSPDAKAMAKEIADSWRTKLGVSVDAAKVYPLDAQTFLQLLATFNIASEFNDDELLKLLMIIGHRKKAPSLCRSLGLLGKMPDFLTKLAKDGKQFEALSLASSFMIMDKIHPVLILKEYLKEAKAKSETALKNATTAAAKSQAITKEITAVKTVLRAITDYKLESQLSTSILQLRLESLERDKEGKKGGSVVATIPSKKPKLNNLALSNTTSVPPAVIGATHHNTISVPAGAAVAATRVNTPLPVIVPLAPTRDNTASVANTRDSTVSVSAVAAAAAIHDSSMHVPALGAVAGTKNKYGGGLLLSGLSIAKGYDEHPIMSAYGTASSPPRSLSSYPYSSDRTISAYGSISAHSNVSAVYGGYQYTSSLEEASAHHSPSVYRSVNPSAYDTFRL